MESNKQFRRKVTTPTGNCMAYERGGKHFIGDKAGQKLRRLSLGKTQAHLIASQDDRAFSEDVKKRLDIAELKSNRELHVSFGHD